MKNILLNKVLNEDGSLKWIYSKGSSIQKHLTEEELDFLKKSYGNKLSEKYYCLKNNIAEDKYCSICNKKLSFKSFKEGYKTYCSNSCTLQGRETKRDWSEKRLATCKKKYNINNSFELVDNEKRKNVLTDKFGGPSPFYSENIQQKIIEAKKQNDSYSSMKKTQMKNHGGTLNGSIETSAKIKNTLLNKYGVDNPNKSEAIKEKKKNTCLSKYGATTYINSEQGFKERSHNYYYKSEQFDSSWELAFWIWHEDNNIKIERNYGKIKYTYSFGKKEKTYMPDFIVNEKEQIKIKSDWYMNTKQSIAIELKKKICNKYNIKIISNDEIVFYLNYINEKYGKFYLRQFKHKLEKNYKRNIIDVTSLENAYKYRNDNVRFAYNCKKCGNRTHATYHLLSHWQDFLCKHCRKMTKSI